MSVTSVEPEDLTRMIATHVAEALWFMDKTGRVTYMNPAAEQTFGWTAEELGGRILHDAVHYKRPDGSPFPLAECPLGQTLFGGVPVRNHEDLWVHRTGRFIPVLCSSTPIFECGEIRGAVVSANDISQLKEAEHALRESSRAKDEFLATVSHELRTPMTAILGWTGFLRMTGVPAELAVAVEQIERSARAQAALVDDLLDMSRIVSGNLRLHLEDVDVAAALDDAVRNVRPMAEAKQMSLTIAAACGGAVVRADPARVRQIVWNLLSNAIKFTPDRGAVAVDARVEGSEVAIAVRDTGIGIAPEFLPRVFDRFAQETTTASYQSGLGLGLAIVRQLAEMHGGRVAVASDGPGRGATFTVWLPRAT